MNERQRQKASGVDHSAVSGANAGSLSPEILDINGLLSELRRSGFLLLRDCNIDLGGFEAFSARFCDRFHSVGTRQPIKAAGSDRFSSEVPKSNYSLFAHSEGAYRPWPPPPDLCFFNCVQAPAGSGGETMLVDGVAFLEKLPSDLRERFTQQGVIYQACWDEGRWQTEFVVSSMAELNSLLEEFPQIEARLDGGIIEVRCHMEAVQESLGGQSAFANGLLAHLPRISHPRWQGLNAYSKVSNRVFFGDGEEIPETVIHQLIDIQDEIAVHHRWREKDLLVLDNARVMHGRRLAELGGNRVIRSRFGRIRPQYKCSGQAGKRSANFLP